MKPTILVLLLVCLTLLAAMAVPERGSACSGNDCGCHLDQQVCDAACPPYPDPDTFACHRDCNKAYKECAIACCGSF